MLTLCTVTIALIGLCGGSRATVFVYSILLLSSLFFKGFSSFLSLFNQFSSVLPSTVLTSVGDINIFLSSDRNSISLIKFVNKNYRF